MNENEPSGRRRWLVPAIVATVVLLLVAAAGVVLATRDGDDDTATAGNTTSVASTTTAPSTTASTAGATTTASTASPGSGTDLEDGRHAAYLTGLDVAGRTIEFDVVQFLTGDEADDAFHEDHPDEPGGVPNDYYIVNDNPRLRTLPVAAGVPVTVVSTSESANAPHPIAFEDLPGYYAADPMPEDDVLWPNPFWLTVDGGTIVAIEEQYTP